MIKADTAKFWKDFCREYIIGALLRGRYIMRLTGDNHDVILRLFNDHKQGRIRDMNARIRGEEGITTRNPANLRGSHTPFASFDDAMSEMNPNHIRGMDATNNPNWRRIIDLPEGAREAMITFAREDFTRNFGGSGGVSGSARSGERQTMLMHSFLREVPEQDRLAANWTMQQIRREETDRIQNAVRQALPNWQVGQRVPDEILRPILNGAGGFNAQA